MSDNEKDSARIGFLFVILAVGFVVGALIPTAGFFLGGLTAFVGIMILAGTLFDQ